MPNVLGIDLGGKHVGLAIVDETDNRVLWCGTAHLSEKIKDLYDQRRTLRRARRSRKRYRKPKVPQRGGGAGGTGEKATYFYSKAKGLNQSLRTKCKYVDPHTGEVCGKNTPKLSNVRHRLVQDILGFAPFAALRWRVGLAVAVCAVAAAADTFVHRKSQERLEGELVGRATREGKKLLVVKIGGELRHLPAAEWDALPDVAKAKKAGFPWPQIVYRGKARAAGWLETMYAQQGGKILKSRGKFVHLDQLPSIRLGTPHASVGDIFAGIGYVSEVLPGARILATLDNLQMVLVIGVETAGWSDGERFCAFLVGLETCQGSARQTLLRCEVVPVRGAVQGTKELRAAGIAMPKLLEREAKLVGAPPAKLTRAEFARALRAGVWLNPVYIWRPCTECQEQGYVMKKTLRYVWDKKLCPACKGKKRLSCAKCSGRGYVLNKTRRYMTNKERCPACRGNKRLRVDITK